VSIEIERADWVDVAACHALAETIGAERRDRIFFPTRGESTKHAKKICAGCTVNVECLNHALDTGEHYGVWGGTSERERRNLRRQRAREAGIRLPGRQPLDEAS
jgi:hypothetical protein